MKYRVAPTRSQWIMIGLLGAAFLFAFLWLIPELMGVFSSEAEDTFSEWVWDLHWGWILAISVVFLGAGFALIWAVGHFWEGYFRRRRKESGG